MSEHARLASCHPDREFIVVCHSPSLTVSMPPLPSAAHDGSRFNRLAAASGQSATELPIASNVSTPRRHWQPAAGLHGVMPTGWWPWLSSRDSLTQRLDSAMRASDGVGLRVRLLLQDTGPARCDEARLLGVSGRRHVWRREVALCHGNTPWVIARSLAALDLAHGHRLSTLGERSLGHWLFRQPDLERSAIDVSRSPLRLSSQQAMATVGSVWMRRSMFSHGRFRVLVQEGFTPEFAAALGL
ncbi:chorismate--pyruvate lyase family protein [Cobetia crustatorum]|uniref:chorismate--pyruvate lyase family protein n=1 Tax=Cobetia crustatorum TaxID=553385 RepID=UPI00200B7D59|nr:chorismate lyase [Cobetia crustatorum]